MIELARIYHHPYRNNECFFNSYFLKKRHVSYQRLQSILQKYSRCCIYQIIENLSFENLRPTRPVPSPLPQEKPS